MASEELSDGRPGYARFLVLLLAEAATGVFVYAVFTFMPTAVQIPITVTVWAILFYDTTFYPKKNKSLASLLCAINGIPVCCCGVAWRITHKDVWSRLALTGACLMAALIFLNRRQEWLDLE
jgi:hypothetical protein